MTALQVLQVGYTRPSTLGRRRPKAFLFRVERIFPVTEYYKMNSGARDAAQTGHKRQATIPRSTSLCAVWLVNACVPCVRADHACVDTWLAGRPALGVPVVGRTVFRLPINQPAPS